MHRVAIAFAFPSGNIRWGNIRHNDDSQPIRSARFSNSLVKELLCTHPAIMNCDRRLEYSSAEEEKKEDRAVSFAVFQFWHVSSWCRSRSSTSSSSGSRTICIVRLPGHHADALFFGGGGMHTRYSKYNFTHIMRMTMHVVHVRTCICTHVLC